MGFIDGIAYTPTLDALAKEGVHFTHAFTAHGQCVPSRASLLTGQSAHESGVMVNYGFFGHQNMLTAKNNTIAKVLKKAGYDTAYFGKGHLGSPVSELGFDHGYAAEKHPLSKAAKLAAKKAGTTKAERLADEDIRATEDAVKFLQNHKPDKKPFVSHGFD